MSGQKTGGGAAGGGSMVRGYNNQNNTSHHLEESPPRVVNMNEDNTLPHLNVRVSTTKIIIIFYIEQRATLRGMKLLTFMEV